jgi:leucyl aminopeptidase
MLHFQVNSTFDSPKYLFIPLLQDEKLHENLAAIADFAGINGEFLQEDFKAEKKEFFTIYSLFVNTKKIILAGLGKESEFSPEILRQVMRSFIHKNKTVIDDILGVDFIKFSSLRNSTTPPNIFVEAVTAGALLGTYEIAQLKIEKPKPITLQLLQIYALNPEIAVQGIHKATIVAKAQMRAYDMVNLPSNHFTPESFAKTAEQIAQEANISVKTFRGDAILQHNLQALYAVGKGSANTPTFSILEYSHPDATKTIGLVGKGVTFDTGGNNIKTQGMALMKCDMAGGAAVLAATEAIAKLGLAVNVICIVPACENSVDGKSYKPSDIIDTYSGLTIEVEDTDAEGRVILADGLGYMVKNYKPDYLFDIATLTGASVISLGGVAGAMFSTDDKTAETIANIGQTVKEKVWRLPLWDDYNDSIKSDMADVKNYGGSAAGCILAAKFLEKFTDKHPAWTHLDVAGVSFNLSEFSKDRSATAFGVRIFVEFAEKIAKE